MSQPKQQPATAALKGKMIIFVLGGPGCGKGTQCERIVQKYGFTHLSTGDLLRNEVASGTPRGKELQAVMARGELVDINIIMTLLREEMIAKAPESKGFLIDGYPRKVEQATKFEKEIAPADVVLYFHVSDDTMKSRLLKRAETSGRADDNEETIGKRLQTFHNETSPVVEHYASIVKTIPAEGTVDDIFVEVKKILG